MQFVNKLILLGIIYLNQLFAQSVEIPDILINQNEIRNIPIFIYDASNLEGITLEISYDNNVFIATTIITDPFGLLGNDYTYLDNITTPGKIHIDIYNPISSSDELFSGSAMLATITIEPIGQLGESSEFNFDDAQINGNYNILKVNGSLEIILDQLQINAEDESGNYNDSVTLGMCDTCKDGWEYGEDEYDLNNAPSDNIDINFYHMDWMGSVDNNGNTCCENNKFSSDYRYQHSAHQLLVWGISGSVEGISSEIEIELTWSNSIISNSDNFNIFLYVGDDIIINMQQQSNLIISQDELVLNSNNSPNIWIKLGACAVSGETKLYYYDYDGDGLGSGDGIEYCQGLEPTGLVENNNNNKNFTML